MSGVPSLKEEEEEKNVAMVATFDSAFIFNGGDRAAKKSFEIFFGGA